MIEDENDRELPSSQPASQMNKKIRKEPPQKQAVKPQTKRRKKGESDDEDEEDFVVNEESEEEKKPKRSASKKQETVKKAGSAKKKAKKNDEDDEMMDDIDRKFSKLVKDGKLKSLKNEDLKEFLTMKNLPAKGNKNFMIELIEEYFESNFNL